MLLTEICVPAKMHRVYTNREEIYIKLKLNKNIVCIY